MADYLANKSMDTRSSWKWCTHNAECMMTKAKGIIAFSDGGYRPGPDLAAAGWVVVAIFDDVVHRDMFSSYIDNINSVSDPFSTTPDLRAVKLAEGARFLPTCRSSYEAELVAVSELILHVDQLVMTGSLPPNSPDSSAPMDL